ncbi:MAG: hypothetical protein ACQET5_09365 [Halobacteriota archaeon]|uniref:DNA replication complex subunit Gins51 n=1 Tax=Natronomonas sp. TaxID=2184060 RepID=UPI0039755C6C
MNLDELQSVQARERQSSDLQHLRSSFYKEVGDFIGELNDKRARVVEAADDPFSEPEVRRLTDDIETAEGTIEAIYERRVGKVVKKASIAAAGMPVEEDGLTREEESLFTDLVDRIEQNRDQVLSVLDGETTTVSCTIDERSDDASVDSVSDDTATADPEKTGQSPASEPKPASTETDPTRSGGGISAADLMGGASGGAARASDADPSLAPPDRSSESASAPDTPSAEAVSPESPPDETAPASPSNTEVEIDAEAREIPGLPRTTVRITANVGEIVGADDRDYDLSAEDVVTLPEPNADVLVEKNAAERL